MPPRKRPRPNQTALKMVGAQVAAARTATGMTQRTLAEAVHVDVETVASIEQGRRALMPDVAERMDRVLDLPGLLTVAANEMPMVDVIPPWAEEYFANEAEAIALSWYDALLVPGLLQTEQYARAVFSCRVPYMGEEKIELQTARRLKRQDILYRTVPPTLGFIIAEAALCDRLGGDDVRRGQLRHLRECADRPAISLQVLPLGLTAHAGLTGSFILLETSDHQRLAYSENQRVSIAVHDANEVSILGQKYAMLRSQALNVADTKNLLERLLGES
ncbi:MULTISPECIES: helix-turn-helix domain-containing protein [Streptomyces]|nr:MULTISPECIES: helix-turn-helix transcriptional regulator [Streptomyces]KOU78708.1 DNA-binding protein [Streptomyces sp. XY593]KOU90292.1 DNA-binding protein [Streptomyces sp. XY533]KOU95845.1 DNA-binding protein [Streptomyces sp. XY511]MBP2345682.1 transcriptional regulator with XRE-family HTH domain [Streptomyces virginiae]MCI4082978.1 helix-turn-helix transcriptional regulator [Streptomyces sp. MMS21 TC-5]